MRKHLLIFFIIAFVLVIDQITKYFLFKVEYFNLIPHCISIANNGGNTGAAWGIFSGNTIALIVVSVVLIVALIVFNCLYKQKTKFYCISFAFVVGGAIGNLIDRIALGYVRDFIFLDFFPTFPIFNIADSFLTVGAVMLAISILFAGSRKATKEN